MQKTVSVSEVDCDSETEEEEESEGVMELEDVAEIDREVETEDDAVWLTEPDDERDGVCSPLV